MGFEWTRQTDRNAHQFDCNLRLYTALVEHFGGNHSKIVCDYVYKPGTVPAIDSMRQEEGWAGVDTIGKWVNMTRIRKAGNVKDPVITEQVQRLDAIGFVWDASDIRNKCLRWNNIDAKSFENDLERWWAIMKGRLDAGEFLCKGAGIPSKNPDYQKATNNRMNAIRLVENKPGQKMPRVKYEILIRYSTQECVKFGEFRRIISLMSK